MKTKQFKWLAATLLLVAAMVMPSTAWAQTMYTVFDTAKGTLTFKYDNSKPESTDAQKVYDVPTTSSTNPGWITNDAASIKTVVFDASFTDARPTTCYKWFHSCEVLTKIEGIKNLNTSEVTDMYTMFYGCWRLTSLDLSSFNSAKVETMNSMFDGCSSLTSLDFSSFNTAKVKSMLFMFNDCSSLTSLDLANFNTDNVTSIYRMFSGCSRLTFLDVSSFNIANVKSLNNMFSDCSSLTSLDLSSFNTANVTIMKYMFNNCSQLTTIYVSDSFTTDGVTNSSDMFTNCSNLVGAIGYDSSVKDKTGANYRTGYFTYAIKTAENLKSFAECVNTTGNGGAAAALFNDITMTENDNVAPIGSNEYKGTFDGRGHSIGGLKINSTNNSLFANNSGTIKNLGVVNAAIASGSNGSICQTNSGTIENCFFAGTAEGTTSPSGAICQTNSGTITNCYYLAESETDVIEGTTAKTANQFKSGEVAWLLNGSSSDGEWGQQIGTEDYPVWGGAKVYQCSPCTAVYS